MKSLYKQWESEIRNYLVNSNLNPDSGKERMTAEGVFDGVKQLLLLDATIDESSHIDFADETPLPVVLMVEEVGGKLVFTQTEYTKTYFS